jgi:arginyl-tRNA synthetase
MISINIFDFRKKKEERIRKLMERLSADAKESVSKLIEKHSQEMLVMIAERLSEVNVSIQNLS